jgi:hypothetical protein
VETLQLVLDSLCVTLHRPARAVLFPPSVRARKPLPQATGLPPGGRADAPPSGVREPFCLSGMTVSDSGIRRLFFLLR